MQQATEAENVIEPKFNVVQHIREIRGLLQTILNDITLSVNTTSVVLEDVIVQQRNNSPIWFGRNMKHQCDVLRTFLDIVEEKVNQLLNRKAEGEIGNE